MIEVNDFKYSKGKLGGYIDGKSYLTKKKKIKASLEGKNYIRFNQVVLILRDNGIITLSDGEEQGHMKGSEFYVQQGYYDTYLNEDLEQEIDYEKFTHTGDKLVYTFSKEKGEIYNAEGKLMLQLKGNIETLEDADYFGIAACFLELYA